MAETPDDPFDLGQWPPVPPKPKPTREPLFEFPKDGRRFVCELRYSEWGVEAVFLDKGVLVYSHRFPTRSLAIMWAEGERRAIETGRADL